MRIVNLGFHSLTDQHLEMLRRLPGVTDLAVETCQVRTLLPMITPHRTSHEVEVLARTAVALAGELEAGDVVVYAGAPDVGIYLDRILPEGVRIVLTMTSNSGGRFQVAAMRDLIRAGVDGASVSAS